MAFKRSVAPRSVYRRQLATRLRELREDADLTLTEVSERVEVSAGALSRIENGERGTTPVLVKALLDCYDLNDATPREDLLDLVRADQAHKRPWWRKYAAVINTTQYGGYLSLEASAVTLNSYEPLLVPGLLQTAGYAHAVISEMRPDLTARQVDTLVKVRIQRQQLLDKEEAPKCWTVIDEAALRRRIGSEEVMLEQLDHLLTMSEHPRVTVQFLPFEAGAHVGLYGSFVLMGFPPPTAEVVWVESFANSVCFEEPQDVGRYTDAFDHVRALALGPRESRRRFQDVIRELNQ